MLSALLDVLFPPRCLGCQRRGTTLCRACWHDLPYLPPGTCSRCASPRGARGTCRGCHGISTALASIRAPFAYEGPARTAVLTLKFRSGRHLVPLMGSFLRDALRNRPVQVDLVVPVPLSPRRHRERGFNQAALLAEQVVDAVGGVLAADALRRRDRPAQSALSGAARRSNLAGAFQCASASDIHGRRVLLVDDVVTTGATLSACADTLALAGAARICAIAFARDL